jgi:ribonuclease VapC
VILDTSALVAILKLEPGFDAIAASIAQSDVCRMSTATLLELWIVTTRLKVPSLDSDVTELLDNIRPRFEPVTLSQIDLAKTAYQQFGKGDHNDSKAKLNFGDCFAYALAREKNEPLLFVGDDFTYTDIQSALEP